MKGGSWKVYLALFLLIVLVAIFPYKEGFAMDDVMSLSWFTTKEKQDVNGIHVNDKSETKGTGETKDKSETKGTGEPKYIFNDKYGSGLSYTDIPYDVSYNHYKFNNLSNP